MKLTDIFKRQPKAEGLTTDMKVRERLVTRTLTLMNCDCRWEDDNGERVAAFDYQNGHFRIRVEKDTPYLRLMYLFFYTTQAEHLNLVRHVCNQSNLNSECERIVYSTNAEKNEVDLHAMTGVLLHPDYARETLARAMQNMFSWQNAFVRRFEELLRGAGKESTDIEADAVKWGHEMSLLREMEIAHQPEGELRDAPDSVQPLALTALVQRLFDLNTFHPLGIEVLDGPLRGTDIPADQVPTLTLRQLLDGQGTLARRCVATLHFQDDTKHARRTLLLMLSEHGGDDQSSYYRLTMTIEPLSARYHDVPFGWSKNQAQTVSALVAMDRVTDKQRVDEFRYMWKEALEKAKAGDTEGLTDEQKLVCEIVDESLAKDLYFGRRHFSNNCFAEALTYLEHAYHQLLPRFKYMKNAQKEQFFEVCYLIGFCYAEMKQYDRAIYYLELTTPLRRITYTTEQVNCMVNYGDIRVEDMVDGLIGELELHHSDGDDDDDDEEGGGGGGGLMLDANVRNFYNFLRRRKVYLLIERESYPYARKLLKDMLKEPENSDFAINELAYLQRIDPKKEGEQDDDIELPF